MRNVPELEPQTDGPRDGEAEAGELRFVPGVGFLPVAIDMPEAQASGCADGGSSREVVSPQKPRARFSYALNTWACWLDRSDFVNRTVGFGYRWQEAYRDWHSQRFPRAIYD